MIIKHPTLRHRWSELDQLKVDDLVNNPLSEYPPLQALLVRSAGSGLTQLLLGRREDQRGALGDEQLGDPPNHRRAWQELGHAWESVRRLLPANMPVTAGTTQ